MADTGCSKTVPEPLPLDGSKETIARVVGIAQGLAKLGKQCDREVPALFRARKERDQMRLDVIEE
jgi:hypothetical protein